MVTLRAGAASAAEQDLHRSGGALTVRAVGSSRLRLVQVARDQRDRVAQTYRSSSLVESVDLDAAIRPAWTPDDPKLADQWALAALGAPAAWDATAHGATSARVAVLDSGIDASHPDLAGRVALSADFTSTETGDRYGHGTAVAGVIAAGLNNGVGIAGLTGASLLDGKVLDDSGLGTESALLDGIVWATDHGARVINLSVGGQGACGTALQAAIDYAWNRGVVLVGAAGNDGSRSVVAPASCAHVIAVGATDSSDARVASSNYGPMVSLAAPGANILSTGLHDSYSVQSGTSLAAAHVSAAAALVWATRWGTTNQAVVDRLLTTARSVPGTGATWRAGGLDLAAAAGASTSAAPSPSPTSYPSAFPSPSPSLTATPGPTETPTATPSVAATATATAQPTLAASPTATPAPTQDPFIYPLACANGFALATPATGTPVATSPNVDPSSGTNATGSATFIVALIGSGCTSWTLAAQLPTTPTLPAGTVKASCNGGASVTLTTTSATVCTGTASAAVTVNYTVVNSWTLTNQTGTSVGITWTIT